MLGSGDAQLSKRTPLWTADLSLTLRRELTPTRPHISHTCSPPPEINKMSLKQHLKMLFILIVCVRIRVHVWRYLVPLSRALGV